VHDIPRLFQKLILFVNVSQQLKNDSFQNRMHVEDLAFNYRSCENSRNVRKESIGIFTYAVIQY